MDDNIVCSQPFEDIYDKLEGVYKVLKEYGITLTPDKGEL